MASEDQVTKVAAAVVPSWCYGSLDEYYSTVVTAGSLQSTEVDWWRVLSDAAYDAAGESLRGGDVAQAVALLSYAGQLRRELLTPHQLAVVEA